LLAPSLGATNETYARQKALFAAASCFYGRRDILVSQPLRRLSFVIVAAYWFYNRRAL